MFRYEHEGKHFSAKIVTKPVLAIAMLWRYPMTVLMIIFIMIMTSLFLTMTVLNFIPVNTTRSRHFVPLHFHYNRIKQ